MPRHLTMYAIAYTGRLPTSLARELGMDLHERAVSVWYRVAGLVYREQKGRAARRGAVWRGAVYGSWVAIKA
jgi:hypothetical protein